LEQGIAELQELLPARSLLGKITGPVRGGVAIEVRMAAQQSDHLIHPWPAAQAGDDPQLRKVDCYVIDVLWMTKIVGPIVGIVHRRVNTNRDVEFDALGVERIITAVIGQQAIVKRVHPEASHPIFLYQPFQFAYGTHPIHRV
jgi:hypothetical protein